MTAEVAAFKQATHSQLVPVYGKKDEGYWKGSKAGNFRVKSAMKFFRGNKEKVKWYKLVWGKEHIPKFSFILWLAWKKRLTTKDRMKSWDVPVEDTSCGLCR